jgi:hypothetical protein
MFILGVEVSRHARLRICVVDPYIGRIIALVHIRLSRHVTDSVCVQGLYAVAETH